MNRYARLICARPWLVVGAHLVLTAWLATGVRLGDTRPILGGELPAEDPIVREDAEFAAHYPDRNFYVLGVEAPHAEGVWNRATLAKIVALSDAVTSIDGALPNVQSLATWEVISAEGDDVEVEPLMKTAPETDEDVAVLRRRAEGDPLLDGRLVSGDGRMALVRIGFREDVGPNRVHGAIEALRERFEGPERIHVFGREYMNAVIDEAVATHIGVLLPIAIVLLHVCYYLCFGRLQAVLLPLLVVVCAEIDYLGMMGHLGIPTSIISSSVPVVLIVAIGSYLEHLMKRVYEEARVHPWRDAVEIATARTGHGVFLACLTTAVGFSSLVTFQIFSIREFGILAAIAVAIGGALSLSLLPAAMLVTARTAPRERWLGRRWYAALVARVTDAAVAASGPRRWHARAFLVLVCAMGIYGITVLRVGSNPPEFFPQGHPFRNGFETLLAHFGADGFLFVDAIAPEGESIFEPEFLRRVQAFQEDAEAVPGVAWASSIVDRVIVRSHRVMNGDDPAFERVPETAELASAYTEVFRWDAPETLAEMTEDVDRPSRLAIDVFADVNDSARIAEIVDALRASAAKHFPTPAEGRAIFGGEWVLWIAQTHYIVVGKIWNVLTSVPMVGLVCLWQLRSLRAAVLSVAPAGFSALVVIGLMGLVGIRLDLASCVITSIVVGIGADFAIHYILRHREVLAAAPVAASPQAVREEAVRLSTPPIFNDAVSNIAAFSVCAASPLVPVREFGWLICLSMAACAVTAITLLPGFLGRRDDRGERSRHVAEEADSEAPATRAA